MGRRKLGGRYKLGRTLGVGAFGKVKEGTNLKTGEKVAIKILNREDIKKYDLIEQVRMEVTALQRIPQHPHIVNLVEVLESQTTLYLVLELVQGCELFDKIKLEGKQNEDTARHYYYQLISAMEFMHSLGICHRDLKLENLLVDSETQVLKVTDFGLSGCGDQQLHTTLGSPNYIAPEVLIGKGYDGNMVDIWSSGVILYVLLAGFLPFDEDNANVLFQKICTIDFQYPSSFSNEAIDLLNHIFVDSSKRYTIEQIKEHAWFQQSNEDYFALMISPEEMIEETSAIHKIHTPCSSNDWQNVEEDDEHSISDADESEDELKQQNTKKKVQQTYQISLQTMTNNNNNNNNTTTDQPMIDDIRPNSSSYEHTMLKFTSINKLSVDGESNASDDNFSVSDYESNSASPRMMNSQQPIKITAFDLIGIVSSQMINNIFTRSLIDHQPQTKTYTRFVSKLPPPTILSAIQEAVHRLADCTCRINHDRYEVKITKRKGHRLIHITVTIFSTPSDDYRYMIDCRREDGNIFRYNEFFVEFKNKYEDAIRHMQKHNQWTSQKIHHSTNSLSTVSNNSSNLAAPPMPMYSKSTNKRQTQIKFRDSNAKKHNRSRSDGAVSLMPNQPFIPLVSRTLNTITGVSSISTTHTTNVTLDKLPEELVPAVNEEHSVQEIKENTLSMFELSASRSTPHHRANISNVSNVSLQSTLSLNTNQTVSHHSSVSSNPTTNQSLPMYLNMSPQNSSEHRSQSLENNNSKCLNVIPSKVDDKRPHSPSQSISTESLNSSEQSLSKNLDTNAVVQPQAILVESTNNINVQKKRPRFSSEGSPVVNISSSGHLLAPEKNK